MKLHWCCGDVYLKGYRNLDISGHVILPNGVCAVNNDGHEDSVDLSNGNINETILENYFKFPFIEDPVERRKNKRPFILDYKQNILKTWVYDDASIDEIVMISCIEHFDPVKELPHILTEINRVLKTGGKLIIDFPDIKKQVDEYHGKDDEFMMELIYCNHKNPYSIHHWGFTETTFPLYLEKYQIPYTTWECKRNDIVKHDYPMIGMECIKR